MLRHRPWLRCALLCWTLLLPVPAAAALCGDADENGSVLASDALRILKVSVGSLTCELCICDSSGNGTITASDALAVLKKAVGQNVALNCVPCVQDCFSSAAPSCGGECEGGLVCAQNVEDPEFCGCFTACELGPAPKCGESCEGSGVTDGECTAATFQVGDFSEDRCLCLPPKTVACGDSDFPVCDGVCQPGHLCTEKGEDCICDKLPDQPLCEEASAPACGGRCSGNTICQQKGEDCSCIEVTGNEDFCGNAEDPQCDAPCENGMVCARDFLGGCSCFEPCEASSAPACGGECPGENFTCTAGTVTVGESVVPFCNCIEKQ